MPLWDGGRGEVEGGLIGLASFHVSWIVQEMIYALLFLCGNVSRFVFPFYRRVAANASCEAASRLIDFLTYDEDHGIMDARKLKLFITNFRGCPTTT